MIFTYHSVIITGYIKNYPIASITQQIRRTEGCINISWLWSWQASTK